MFLGFIGLVFGYSFVFYYGIVFVDMLVDIVWFLVFCDSCVFWCGVGCVDVVDDYNWGYDDFYGLLGC